jgi:hypothetical protein
MAKKRRKAKVQHKPRPPQLSSLSAQATQYFQEEIRKSPLWAKMVAEFGEEEAARLLQQMRLDIH